MIPIGESGTSRIELPRARSRRIVEPEILRAKGAWQPPSWYSVPSGFTFAARERIAQNTNIFIIVRRGGDHLALIPTTRKMLSGESIPAVSHEQRRPLESDPKRLATPKVGLTKTEVGELTEHGTVVEMNDGALDQAVGIPSEPSPGYEWKTRLALFGIPLICVSFGRDARGRPKVAKGFIAIGQFAVGGITISQFGLGVISIGQFALGLASIGQVAIGMLTGIGQLGVGVFAVGQVVAGIYGRGQTGWAQYMWSPEKTDIEAVAMFNSVTWLLHQKPAVVLDVIKFGLNVAYRWIVSLFS